MEALWISPVFPALVQAVIAECTESAPMNAENGAFVSGVAAKRVAGHPTEGEGGTNIKLCLNPYFWNFNKLGLWF